METRQGKIQIGKAGGTAGGSAMNCRVSIPTAWIKEIGINEDDRSVILTFDGENIIIRKG